MGDLSAHFSASEFTCRATGHRLLPPAYLLQLLEQVRREYGQPVRILSGHRCCAYNEQIGGAPQSRHITGDAVDLVEGVLSVDRAIKIGFTGIGQRGDWAVHVDVRPGPLTRWHYQGLSAKEVDDPLQGPGVC